MDHMIKDCPLLKEEQRKNSKKQQELASKAFKNAMKATWGETSDEESEGEDGEGNLALMAKSDTDSDNDSSECFFFTLRPHGSQLGSLITSSGTSGGESKLIPTTEGKHGRRSELHKLQMSVMSQAVPDYGNGKAMYFMFMKSEEKTSGGLTARTLSTSIYKSPYFDYSRPRNNYTSPPATFSAQALNQSMYSQMLCGLCQNQQVLRLAPFSRLASSVPSGSWRSTGLAL
ncbi:hypothetical protein HAX54_047790 [Datura stramonium]|uniref:Uncharacterized protein n=1 Tax=Datura stramonium TaxID=4076 RepID=A0ABS8RQF3_DATST|nr:hypothetical protein [Datura stramonium]